jgi:hypothetical protein|tara:strand:- start:39 stop:353 length:315 start_codon:yes stop_codon:yes gene_type:complete
MSDDCEHNRPTLCWKDTFGTDREYEMAFGYDANDGEPTVAIMWEGCEHPLSIPITVMLEGIATGWGNVSEDLMTMLTGMVIDNGGFFSATPRLSCFMPGDPALN